MSDHPDKPSYSKNALLESADRLRIVHLPNDEDADLYRGDIAVLWQRMLQFLVQRFGSPSFFVKDLFGRTGDRHDIAEMLRRRGGMGVRDLNLLKTVRPGL